MGLYRWRTLSPAVGRSEKSTAVPKSNLVVVVTPIKYAWTVKPGVLQSTESQWIGHNLATEQQWQEALITQQSYVWVYKQRKLSHKPLVTCAGCLSQLLWQQAAGGCLGTRYHECPGDTWTHAAATWCSDAADTSRGKEKGAEVAHSAVIAYVNSNES